MTDRSTSKKVEITIKVWYVDENESNPRMPTTRRLTMEATPHDCLDIERCQQVGSEEIGRALREAE